MRSRSRIPHFAAAAVLAGITTTVFTGVASAHNKDVSAQCTQDGTKLSVNLTYYSNNHQNTVKITNGDETLVDETFGANYRKQITVDATVKHDFKVTVRAGDDASMKHPQWHLDWAKTVEACKKPAPQVPTVPVTTTTTTAPVTTTTTTESPAVTTTTEESTPVETSPETTTTAVAGTSSVAPTPVPVASKDELADTGASIAVPAAIGGALLVGGAGALFLVRRRAKQN